MAFLGRLRKQDNKKNMDETVASEFEKVNWKFISMFSQPVTSPSFLATVHSNKVCLENAFPTDLTTLSGVIRVLNISFTKTVTVRWTVNDWASFSDQAASYVEGDGTTDQFRFKLVVGRLPVGSRVQFCIRLDAAGAQFWDNNYGTNYSFKENKIKSFQAKVEITQLQASCYFM